MIREYHVWFCERPGVKFPRPTHQYFVGLPGYQMEAPFAPSLFVEIRKRMGQSVFEVFHGAIIEAVEEARATKPSRSRLTGVEGESEEDHDDDPPPGSGEITLEEGSKRQGKLILDATHHPLLSQLYNEQLKVIQLLHSNSVGNK